MATTQTRYATKARILDAAGKPTGAYLYYRLKPGAPAPVRGGIVALSSDLESISEAAFNAMSTDCAGVAPPAVTYSYVQLWARRAIVIPVVNKINQVLPKYERGFGITNQANANGPCYGKLEPMDGQAFTDTAYYGGELFAGDGYPGSFRHIYPDNMPIGRYLATWKPEGNNNTMTGIVTVVRSGAAPYVARPFADWNITAPGDAVSAEIAGTFVDPDGGVLTYTADANGQPLPYWLTFNPTASRPFTVAAGAPNTSVAIVITATDPDGLTATDAFLITVNRRVLLRISMTAPLAMDEGTGTQLAGTAVYTGSTAGSESGESINLANAKLYLAGPDGVHSEAFATKLGVSLGVTGLLTADVNTTVGDSRQMSVKLEFGGKSTTASILVNDKSTPAANRPPVVNTPAGNLVITKGQPFTKTWPADAFTDPDGDALTYSLAAQGDSGWGPLPAGWNFNPATRTLTGTAPSVTGYHIGLRLTADDGRGGITHHYFAADTPSF